MRATYRATPGCLQFKSKRLWHKASSQNPLMDLQDCLSVFYYLLKESWPPNINGQDKRGQKREQWTGQDTTCTEQRTKLRTGQGRTEDRTGQYNTGQNRTGQDRRYDQVPDRTGDKKQDKTEDRIGQDLFVLFVLLFQVISFIRVSNFNFGKRPAA